jgi:hypothetical protein
VPYANNNGVKIYYEMEGQGPALMVPHIKEPWSACARVDESRGGRSHGRRQDRLRSHFWHGPWRS